MALARVWIATGRAEQALPLLERLQAAAEANGRIGSIASSLHARALLGPGVRLVAGFHTVSGKLLSNLSKPIEIDIMLAGDDPEAEQTAAELAQRLGARAVDVRPLENSATPSA